jgi:cytochrome b involved in lipid metabolism
VRLTVEEVALHANEHDCWVIVNDQVYDVTEFLASHPGGSAILAGVGGTDASAIFNSLHDASILHEVALPFHLGALGDSVRVAPAATQNSSTSDTLVATSSDGSVGLDPKVRFGEHFPKAMRWLAARWEPKSSRLPVSLRPLSSTPGHSGGTGMNPLEPRLWLEHDWSPAQRDPSVSRFVNELGIKRRLLHPESPHYDTCFQALPDSGPEQEELLHYVVNHLREHHAAEYRFGEDTVEVLATGDVYRISDFVGKRDHLGNPKAMLLASLLVQEEFYILRREGTIEEFAVGNTEPYRCAHGSDRAMHSLLCQTSWRRHFSKSCKWLCGLCVLDGCRYVFIAGTAAINLVVSGIKGERNDFRLGAPMHAIHGRVPGKLDQLMIHASETLAGN